jgi:hypothetical protein
MSTLLSTGRPGKSRRVCNAQCYNARGPDCNCMCGGINHGVGEMQARENCRSMGVAWVERAKRLPSFRRRKRFIRGQGLLFAYTDQVWDGVPVPHQEICEAETNLAKETETASRAPDSTEPCRLQDGFNLQTEFTYGQRFHPLRGDT